MNRTKLLAPDFLPGKVIVTRKAIVDNIKILVRNRWSPASVRFAKLMLTIKPNHTMVTNRNLLTLYNLVHRARALRLAGDIVECGTWNGGSAAVMAVANHEAAQATNAPTRPMWLFDSYEGVPRPGENDGARERDAYWEGWNKASIANVRRIFTKLGLPLDDVHIVKGWFDATLPTAPIEHIALLHCDADWYASVKVVFEALYDKVVPGGFVVINDYGTWPGCKKAVDEFLASRGLSPDCLTQVEVWGGAYFQKP